MRLKNSGRLPPYYITEDAIKRGWNRKLGNFQQIAPGCMISKGVYRNDDRHLPSDIGRIWYEADINYTFGHRNDERLVFSNDGLIFVTYDHYETFYEIVKEKIMKELQEGCIKMLEIFDDVHAKTPNISFKFIS